MTRKKHKAVDLTLSDFKTYCKATVIKIVWHLNEDRYINQWHQVESPEINPNLYSQMNTGNWSFMTNVSLMDDRSLGK